jgi:hypothetical protein
VNLLTFLECPGEHEIYDTSLGDCRCRYDTRTIYITECRNAVESREHQICDLGYESIYDRLGKFFYCQPNLYSAAHNCYADNSRIRYFDLEVEFTCEFCDINTGTFNGSSRCVRHEECNALGATWNGDRCSKFKFFLYF